MQVQALPNLELRSILCKKDFPPKMFIISTTDVITRRITISLNRSTIVSFQNSLDDIEMWTVIVSAASCIIIDLIALTFLTIQLIRISGSIKSSVMKY